MWKYLSWFYRKCELVFVPSPSMQEILEEKKIETDFRIWARGIESEIFNPGRRSDEWRKKHGFEPEDIVITFISRLVWEKNLKLFADVVNKITKKREHAKAMIVGDGPAMGEMKELMPDAVFTGFLGGADLATAYASSDIFFFPSDTETFGNVTLEAMASGLPAVVADATGSKSLVKDGENGFVIPVESTDKFYTFIDKLVTDSELRKGMGQDGLEKSKSYSWDSINNNLVGYYREVLKEKG